MSHQPLKATTSDTILQYILEGKQGYVNTYVGLCLRLQQATGARVSEILALTWAQISNDGDVYIRQGKRGISHVVRCPDLVPVFAQMKGDPNSLVIRITYRQMYSAYRRLGISALTNPKSKHHAVCHLPRHQRAQQVFDLSGRNAEAAGHCLGHRSKSSINHYLTEEQINETA